LLFFFLIFSPLAYSKKATKTNKSNQVKIENDQYDTKNNNTTKPTNLTIANIFSRIDENINPADMEIMGRF
jgi:hypothetical protein